MDDDNRVRYRGYAHHGAVRAQAREGRAVRAAMRTAAARARRARLLSAGRYTWLLASVVVVALLLVVQQVSFRATGLPVRMTITPTGGTFYADGQQLHVAWSRMPTRVVFAPPPALTREFQIDGTDATNNFTEDPASLARIADNPYYRFQAWMRDAGSYSSWHDVALRMGDGPPHAAEPSASGEAAVDLAGNGSATLDATLLRPEVPAHVYLMCQRDVCGEMVINRNDRFFEAIAYAAGNRVLSDSRAYFPQRPLPFAAEVVYLLAHVLLWAAVLLVAALLLAAAALPLSLLIQPEGALARAPELCKHPSGRLRALKTRLSARLDGCDVAALALSAASLGFTSFIALAQYHAQPHILDASAYYFQAKVFATGRLAAPVPEQLGAFQGPFMVAHDGRWFTLFAPLTSVLLAVGILIGVPWLVEPVLGTLALWGLYRIAKRLFGARTALLALALGVLSPFYSYLAASYLSHTVALFFVVYFVLFLLRFTDEYRARELALAAVCASGMLLTRELTAALVGFGATAWIFGLSWRGLLQAWRRVLPALAIAAAIAGTGVLLYLLYDKLQTGNALLTPRNLFSPADRYGFGVGIGFYGRHTPAAGLVVLDQLLTTLLIDLYGWPFYLTLALVPLAFLHRWRDARWDLFCLFMVALLIGAQAGYFYHGIYLGPRHLFEALPFLLLLTARGLTALPTILTAVWTRAVPALPTAGFARIAQSVVAAVLLALLLCNLVYYMPRQLALHTDFTGLPAAMPVKVTQIYDYHPGHAVVVTDNWFVYNYILWPLNDPDLRGATLYAYAPSPGDVATLRALYPDRTFYSLTVTASGDVSYSRLG
jgi:hypothetical protein